MNHCRQSGGSPGGIRSLGIISAHRYTLSDGLGGMQVEDIYQDRRGLLWIATADGGISRFDGTRFDTFNMADGLPHPTVMAIAEDAAGKLWFGTFGGGLASFEDGGFQVYTTEHGLPSNEIVGLQPQGDGSLRVLTSAGFGSFVGGQCSGVTTDIESQPIGRVYDMATDAAGTTWLATQDRGVISLDGQELEVNDGVGAVRWVWKFAQDQSGYLWIASHRRTGRAIARYDPKRKRLERIDAIAGVGGGHILPNGARHVRVDHKGWVWVALRRDVLVYDGRDWHSFSQHFPDVEFRQARVTYEDRDGNIWVGMYNRGLVLFDPLSFKAYTEADGLPHRNVTCLEEDGAGRLWIGTEGGLAFLEDGRIQRTGMSRTVYALGVDGEEMLWVGEENQVFKGPGLRARGIPLCSQDEYDFAIGLRGDMEGRFWVFTRGGKRGWIEGDRIVEVDQGLPRRIPFRCVGLNRDGGFWIGAKGSTPALYHVEKDLPLKAAEFPGLKSVFNVTALCEHQRTLWVGTNTGLFAVEYESGKVRQFTKDRNGLPANTILSLAVDGSHRLWVGLGGGGGVLKYDGRTFHNIRLGSSVEEDSVNTILCDSRGRLWFGTLEGLKMYGPPHTPPGIVIRRIVKGRLLEATRSVVFPEDIPEIAIHFQGIRFRAGGSGQMGYSHRLVGHGPAEEWSDFATDRMVAYRGLPAGEYRFEVRARDMDDLVSEVAGLEVQVVPTRGGGLEDPEDEPPASLQTGASRSPTVSGFLSGLGHVVNTGMTLLLAGETGTGKSLLAREIHNLGPRREHPFVQINCGALPPGLVESELFGREQGMFSGAATGQTGCFERAHGGTLVLDAVSDLPLQAQGALLHVLEDGQVRRVGGSDPVQVDVRVIAATNSDLQEAVGEGAFRQDLYYRLSEFPVVLPPLRKRREDIPVLAAHFAARSADELKRPVPNLGEDVVEHLQRHSWPGNVRELEHMIRRAVVLCEGSEIQVSNLPLSAEWPGSVQPAGPEAPEVKDEKQQLLDALKATNWIVYGDRGAARLLGMHPEKLRYRMSKYGLRRPKP